MIVFDLKCGGNHVFEAWFSSSASFDDQRERGLIACPVCGDTEIAKAVMAPNVGAKGNSRNATADIPVVSGGSGADAERKALLSALARMQSALIEDSTWVGTDFDSKARAMEAGDIERATIHGQVTTEEAAELVRDGISVMPLPFPVIPPDKRN